MMTVSTEYRIYEVNAFGEEIDYIDKSFATEQEAYKYLWQVLKARTMDEWEVRKVTVYRDCVGVRFNSRGVVTV